MSAKRQESSVRNCVGSPRPRYGTFRHLHAVFAAIESLGVPKDRIGTRTVGGRVMILVEYLPSAVKVSACQARK